MLIKQKLALLPAQPGCYLMKNQKNEIIYVGKAKLLKNRVKQYFTGVHDNKTQRLVNEIVDFEYIITDSEKDALILEINLIKKYQPKYNIALKDGKSYPFIRLDANKIPILSTVRNQFNKNSKYFGPFPNVSNAKATIQLLNQIYGLFESHYLIEKESDSYEIKNGVYQVKQHVIDNIKKFLNGDIKVVETMLKQKMQWYSDQLMFEQAKTQYDLLKAIQEITMSNRVQLKDNKDQDVIGYYAENGYLCVQIFMIRSGKLIERTFEIFDIYTSVEEALLTFIATYYELNTVPKNIIISSNIDVTLLDLPTKWIQPKMGEKKALLLNVEENAKNQLQNHFILKTKSQKNQEIIQKLSVILNCDLSKIEVFDNAHFASTHNVSGMITLINGEFSKKDYRLFKLQNYISDDHSMQEVIYRRYYRLLMEDKQFPTAIFVDGGKQQVFATKNILNDLNVSIPVFGLVKDEKHKTSQIINQNGEIMDIDKKSQEFFYLIKIQDEIHRYVTQYHRHIRSKSMMKSFLDDIEYVGEKRKQKLLRHFKTIQAIKNATFDQLQQIVGEKAANSIINKK